tara:strand:+ start:44 stop:427 length:384 start_codon:yes stop_codon:yes gene_type:complete
MIKIALVILLLSVFYSCSNKEQYLVYPTDQVLDEDNFYDIGFKLYFNESEIKSDYINVAVIATDMYYYGNFFFDDIFMSMLEKKVFSLKGNAVIYNKDKIDFDEYNEDYLYFQVIQVIEKKSDYNIR